MSFPKRSDIFNRPVWQTEDVISRPSLDTFYQVNFAFSGSVNQWLNPEGTAYGKKSTNLVSGSRRLSARDVQYKMMLLCTEAEIPGTSFQTTEAIGHRQGIAESFPTLRQFPPLNLTFYLDADHVILEVFEKWMQYINPLETQDYVNVGYSRFNYPMNFKERLHITKYERNFDVEQSKMSQYEFVNVWPSNLTSMRVNYGSSNVVRLSVQLVYDRYFTQFSVVDARRTPLALPPEIKDTNTIVNSNDNNWWSRLGGGIREGLSNVDWSQLAAPGGL